MGQVVKIPVQLHILRIKRKDASEINEVQYGKQDCLEALIAAKANLDLQSKVRECVVALNDVM